MLQRRDLLYHATTPPCRLVSPTTADTETSSHPWALNGVAREIVVTEPSGLPSFPSGLTRLFVENQLLALPRLPDGAERLPRHIGGPRSTRRRAPRPQSVAGCGSVLIWRQVAHEVQPRIVLQEEIPRLPRSQRKTSQIALKHYLRCVAHICEDFTLHPLEVNAMKVVAILGVLVLLLLAPPAVSQAPDDKLIVPGQRIGKWTLDMTVEDLDRMNGQGSPGRTTEPGFQPGFALRGWPEFGLLAGYREGQARVEFLSLSILVSTSGIFTFKTKEGIGILSK